MRKSTEQCCCYLTSIGPEQTRSPKRRKRRKKGSLAKKRYEYSVPYAWVFRE